MIFIYDSQKIYIYMHNAEKTHFLQKKKKTHSPPSPQQGQEYFNKKLSFVCFSWLHDPVYTIREAATMNLKKLVGEFGGEWVEKTVLPEILELRKSDKYAYRVTCIIAVKVSYFLERERKR